MIITLCFSFFAMSLLSYFLFKNQKKLKNFSILIPIQTQKESLEKQILILKEDIEKQTKAMLDERNTSIENKSKELSDLVIRFREANDKVLLIEKEIVLLESKQNELLFKDDLIESSFYNPKYNFLNSEKYKERLEIIKDKQKICFRGIMKILIFSLLILASSCGKDKLSSQNSSSSSPSSSSSVCRTPSNSLQGCCSSHGGAKNCSVNGQYLFTSSSQLICNDGTISPSCISN